MQGRVLALILALGLAAVVGAPERASAHDCACTYPSPSTELTCLNPVGRTFVPDASWLTGPSVFTGSTFIVPAGCDHIVTTAPSGGIRVRADRLVFDGSLISTPSGGEGVLFQIGIAPEPTNGPADIILSTGAHIESGGLNKLPNTLVNFGVAKSSVGLQASGDCTIIGTLRGNPVTASGAVGIGCVGDVFIKGVNILANQVDIQSLTGVIDATCTAGGGGGGVCPANGEGLACDNPATNGAGNGNNNGVLDAGDFPCQPTFTSASGVCAFCAPTTTACTNTIRACGTAPLEMIAKGDLLLNGAGNIYQGTTVINLVSEDGNVDLDGALVTNQKCDASGGFLGGAKTFVFANPASVTRFPVGKEKSFGPSTGTIGIDATCFLSPIDIRIGKDGPDGIPGPPFDQLIGTPAPLCAQNPADFLEVLNGP